MPDQIPGLSEATGEKQAHSYGWMSKHLMAVGWKWHLASSRALRGVLACVFSGREGSYVHVGNIGHKDEEAVLCVNCDISSTVPRSTRRTGVFIDFRASDASSAYSAWRRETGEASFVLRVEISRAMHAVRQHIVFNSSS
jgi:hypothetical protein